MAKTILAIGAHADDAEIGAGGALIRAARAGHRVVILTIVGDFSSWLPTRGREEQTRRDLVSLAERFGMEKRFLDYPYHQIDGGDLDLKRALAQVYAEVRPDMAFIQHPEDHWPDHVASGRAGHDALLFAHGLTGDLSLGRCPLIYSYDASAHQTYGFEPDVFCDITGVMPEFMELVAGTDACLSGRPVEETIAYEFRTLGEPPQVLRLSGHGLGRFGDCVRFGDQAGCRFAMGFRRVWGGQCDPAFP